MYDATMAHVARRLVGYVARGVAVGPFLRMYLEGDLRGALGWLIRGSGSAWGIVPFDAWGSPEAVRGRLSRGSENIS